MKRPSIISALCVVAGILSCQKEHNPRPVVNSDSTEICFTAVQEAPENWNPLSKAVNVDSAYLSTNGFGVYAYYTGADNYGSASDVDGIVMNNRKVVYGTDYKYNVSTSTWTSQAPNKAWIYYGQNYYGTNQPAYKEYWPMKDGEKMTFFAYAPYNLWYDKVTPSGSSCHGEVPSIPYQLYKSGDTGVSMSGNNPTVTVQSGTFSDNIQRDILWGVRSTGYPYKNFTRPSSTTAESKKNTVDFRFRHALSKISFNVLTEDVPTVSDAVLVSWAGNNAVTPTAGNQTSRAATYPVKTVYLLEYVTISSSDGLLANSSTLSLDNTTAADHPEWSRPMVGSITYNFTNASTGTLGTSIRYYKDGNQTSNYSNNRNNYSTLLTNRTSVNGMSATPSTLMGSASNSFYALPGNGEITVTVKYHRISYFYYYGNNSSSRYWTVYDGADNIDAITRSFPLNLEAGRAYNINFVLQGNDLDFELEVQPWALDTFTYEYTDANYSVIEFLTFDSDYMDYRIDDKVYINNRVGKFSFRVNGGRYLYWRASLIPNSAFAFTDKHGNYLTDTQGELLTMLPGSLDKDISNEIYIKALNTSSTTLNSARLRLYFYDGEGHAVVPLNLINLKTSGNESILEWTVVQNAN